MNHGKALSGGRPGLAADRQGGVAVLTSISLVGLMGVTALAMDVSSAVSAQSKLRQAADTAALAAVRQAALDTSSNSNASLTPAQSAGAERFAAQANAIPQVSGATAAVQVVRNGLTITATVSFNATYKTQVAGVLSSVSTSAGQVASIPLGGTVAAQQQVGAYVDLQVLMDTSNSMAIAATAKDAGSPNNPGSLGWATTYVPMWYNSGGYGWQNCTVACHAVFSQGYKVAPIPQLGGYAAQPPLYGGTSAQQQFYQQQLPPGTSPNASGYPPANSSTYDPLTYDFYALARYIGATLRIDLLKQSVASIANAIATAPDGDKFRFGFYTFDLDARQVFALGSASKAGPVVGTTEVTPIPYPDDYPAQTNVAQSIRNFTASYVAAAGDGSSQAQAKKFVVILTDGVEDFQDSDGRETATFDPTSCGKLKEAPGLGQGGKGAGVFVLQAASLDNFITNNGQDPTTFFNASVAAMKACASSPDYYFLASSPEDIAAATQTIVNLALSKPTVLLLPSSTVTTAAATQ